MKASFVFTLLAIFVCAEAVKFPGLASTPPFLTSKTSLAAAFDAHNRQALSTSPVDNKYYPYTTIDFGLRRNGVVYSSQRTTSFEECFRLCRADSSRCVAINYQHQIRTCQKLQTLGGLGRSCYYVTCLVNYKVYDDPCSETYFQNNFRRSGFFYSRTTIVGTRASRECCSRC